MTYRVGTRGSKLALVQTEGVVRRLAAAYPGDTFETVVISTKGDRVTDRPIAKIGDAALFTREIEEALRDGRIDLAVHSMKDLAAECPPGLTLAKAWTREDPRDVLVLRDGAKSLADLPEGATVATGSVRRNAILHRLRPDLRILDIRGNVDTRLRKLFASAADEPRLDGIVLAAAGLVRLGRTDVVSAWLEPAQMLPAANQGQLAIELRTADVDLKAKIDALADASADRIARAERGFLREIGADCHVPVAAYAREEKGGIRLDCLFARSASDRLAEATVWAETPEEAARRAAIRIRRQVAGLVTLVGAGPGDPDLITVKGLSSIRAADCLVYDRLVSPALLKEASAECELVYVGKESGHHTLPQDEINAFLAAKAMVYDRVVRLKGGDPFVFGRGGEELEYLSRLGIRASVVPGVTSAVAAPGAAGIPVTHRGVASGFAVVTAHARDNEPLSLDFSKMTDPARTYVFLMGLARVQELADGLVAAGREPTTSAAVIASATLPEQRSVFGTLADIASRVAAANLASPAVLVVGAVAGLPASLGFPLAGRRFLVPVIDGGSRRLPARLRELGAAVDEVVVGRIERIENAVTESDLAGVRRIVLTSRNGRLGLDERVRSWIAARKIRVEEVREIKPDGATLHLTQPDADRVEGVRAIDVYRNVPVEIEGRIDLGQYDAAFFTCASSVRRVFARAEGVTRLYSIGPKTSAAFPSSVQSSVITAARPDLAALVDLLEQGQI